MNENLKLWRTPGIASLELLRATFIQQRFTRHTHENYAVGVIERGALGYFYRGEHVIAGPGMISLVIPGEAHDGHPLDEHGWAYRMFYLDATLMRQVASQLAGKPAALPFFRPGVINDPVLARQIRRIHYRFEGYCASQLEQESALLEMLAQFILRHAEPACRVQAVGHEPRAVQRVRNYIEDHYADNLSIQTLADVACLSPYHFIRVFRKRLGIAPHAYLMQVRTRRAKEMLLHGRSIVRAALDCGFGDQSHLNRHFNRIYGLTPGQYRNFVQDSSRTVH